MIFDGIFFESNKQNNVYLYDSKEGFLKGNMFKNEYDQYKNYNEFKIIPENEKELLMLNIYECDFAMNDLSLMLDLHPDNNELYKQFKNYAQELDMLTKKYESKYGPMNLCDSNYSEYKWYIGPWPFEGGRNV